MATSFKRSHACTATLSTLHPAAGHHRPTPPLETPGHTQESLGQSLVGSLLLSPGSWCTQCSVCALQESISQSCVSSGSSLLGLMATSSKRAYAIPKSAASRAPTPTAGPCLHWRLLDTPGQGWVNLLWSQCSLLLGLVCTRFCLCPLRVYFPVLCKFWWHYGGVNGNLFQEGLCHTQVCCTQ